MMRENGAALVNGMSVDWEYDQGIRFQSWVVKSMEKVSFH